MRDATGLIIFDEDVINYIPPSTRQGQLMRNLHAIEKAEARLDRAIHNRGEHSREADERRRELHAERERCWNQHHQWWNGKEHRWETEHNWDHDHDNDHH